MRAQFTSLVKKGAMGGLAYYVAYPTLKTDTQFFYQQTPYNKAIIDKSNGYLKAYIPGFGISGRVRQVLFNIWFAKDIVTHINYERTNLKMEDGGTISVDWATAE